jgi:CDP-diacylglycerol--glycerol-3-phosphate 3-phosphatidyltransferase
MASPTKQRFWNVPNSLTMSRLLLAIIVFALIEYQLYLPALVVFILAAITDALDGYFARLLNQTSAIGRQLDPLVDKLVICGGLIYLLTVPKTGLSPWMVTVIVARELLVQALRSLIEGKGEAFGAKMAGKLKTTFQCLAIGAILFILGTQAGPSLVVVRDILIWTAVGLTIYSGIGYVIKAWPNLKREAEAA